MPLDDLWNSLVGGDKPKEQAKPEAAESGPLNDLWGKLVGAVNPIGTAEAGVVPFKAVSNMVKPSDFAPKGRVPSRAEQLSDAPYTVFDARKEAGHEGIFPSEDEAKKFIEGRPDKSYLDYANPRTMERLNPTGPESEDYLDQRMMDAIRRGKAANTPAIAGAAIGGGAAALGAGAAQAAPNKAEAPSSIDGLWKGLLGGGDPEAKGAAEASKAMEPAVTDFAKKGIAGELGVPSALEQPERTEGTLAQRALDPQGLAKATNVATGIGPGTIGQVGKDVVKGIEKILSPTTVDPTSQAAEALIRKETGVARRQTEIANAQADPFRAAEMPHLGEFNARLQTRPPGGDPSLSTPQASDPAILKMFDYVEGRSKGATFSGPQELSDFADLAKKLYSERKMAIAAEPTTSTTSFIDDYFSHQWQEKTKAPAMLGGMAKQGSGTSLKERQLPTIRDGLAAGLTPTGTPTQMMMGYIQNMDRFLATNRIFRAGTDSGMIRRYAPGDAPEGWVPLNGRLSRVGATDAYAPAGFGQVYNNFIDPGWYAGQLSGNVYNGLLRFTNTLTAAKLGFSAYHGAAMAQESAVSGLAKSFGELGRGELQKGLKDAGYSITILPKMAESTSRGTKLQKQYLEAADYGPEYQKVADLLAKGGGRPIGRGAEYRGSAMDNYFQAWKRGTAKAEMGSTLGDFGRAPIGTLFREYGRIMDTVAAPLFDELIPKLKTGAYFDEMSSWLRQNPMATAEQQLAKSRELIDVMDDRFGEMIMDNIFWNKRLKQSLQLMATSVGWELGSARALGGGAKDLLSGKWTPRSRWLASFAVIMATSDAVYQYLKTGKAPQGAQDLIAPQTGGKTPEGAPERAILPGYEKDVLGVWQNVGKPLAQGAPGDALRGAGNLAYQKRNPAIQLSADLATNKDWRGNPLSPSTDTFWQSFGNYAKHIGEALLPIPLSQTTYPGSNISLPERFGGIRAAPGYLTDPKRSGNLEKVHKLGEDARALSIEIRDLERQGRLGEADKLKVKRKDVTKQRNDLMKQLPKPRAQLDYFEGRGYSVG